jgi:hypothetical protein
MSSLTLSTRLRLSQSTVVTQTIQAHITSCVRCTIPSKGYCRYCSFKLIRRKFATPTPHKRFDIVYTPRPIVLTKAERAMHHATAAILCHYALNHISPPEFSSPHAVAFLPATEVLLSFDKLTSYQSMSETYDNPTVIALRNGTPNPSRCQVSDLTIPYIINSSPLILIDASDPIPDVQNIAEHMANFSHNVSACASALSKQNQILEISRPTKPVPKAAASSPANGTFTLAAASLLLAKLKETPPTRGDSLSLPDICNFCTCLPDDASNYPLETAASSLTTIFRYCAFDHSVEELKGLSSAPPTHRCNMQPCLLTFLCHQPNKYRKAISPKPSLLLPVEFLILFISWVHKYYTDHSFSVSYLCRIVSLMSDIGILELFRSIIETNSAMTTLYPATLIRSLTIDNNGQTIPIELLDPPGTTRPGSPSSGPDTTPDDASNDEED